MPKYRHATGSWYASNFAPVVGRPDAITLDASPTYFNSPRIAPPWLGKWLPDAKLVVLLRDPVQRTYSHWRMGLEWLKASRCYRTPDPEEVSKRAAAAAGGKPVVVKAVDLAPGEPLPPLLPPLPPLPPLAQSLKYNL